MARLQLAPDELLSTTRAVRRRLDLTRPVERGVLEECLDLAFQAPPGGGAQGWHVLLVAEPEPKRALADLYRRAKREHDPVDLPPGAAATMTSSAYLAEHLHEVPVLVVPCARHPVRRGHAGRPDPGGPHPRRRVQAGAATAPRRERPLAAVVRRSRTL